MTPSTAQHALAINQQARSKKKEGKTSNGKLGQAIIRGKESQRFHWSYSLWNCTAFRRLSLSLSLSRPLSLVSGLGVREQSAERFRLVQDDTCTGSALETQTARIYCRDGRERETSHRGKGASIIIEVQQRIESI